MMTPNQYILLPFIMSSKEAESFIKIEYIYLYFFFNYIRGTQVGLLFFLFCPFNACDFYLSLYISISRKHESTLWESFPYPRQVYKETGSKAFR